MLSPEGYLFMESAETALGITDRIEGVRQANTSVYRAARPVAVGIAS